jgi:WD40 repeat protein
VDSASPQLKLCLEAMSSLVHKYLAKFSATDPLKVYESWPGDVDVVSIEMNTLMNSPDQSSFRSQSEMTGRSARYLVPPKRSLQRGEVATAHDEITHLVVSSSGHYLVTSNKAQVIRLWSTKYGKLEAEFTVTSGNIIDFIFVEDMAFFASVTDGSCRAWYLQGSESFKESLVDGMFTGSVASSKTADESVFFASARMGNQVHVRNLHKTDSVNVFLKTATPITCLAFSSDGRYLAAGMQRLSITVWSTQSWEESFSVIEIDVLDQVQSMAFSEDNEEIAVYTKNGRAMILKTLSKTLNEIGLGLTGERISSSPFVYPEVVLQNPFR